MRNVGDPAGGADGAPSGDELERLRWRLACAEAARDEALARAGAAGALRAFHNDVALRADLLAQVDAASEAQFITAAFDCKRLDFRRRYGLPVWLYDVCGVLMERARRGAAVAACVAIRRIIASIPPGADISRTKHALAIDYAQAVRAAINNEVAKGGRTDPLATALEDLVSEVADVHDAVLHDRDMTWLAVLERIRSVSGEVPFSTPQGRSCALYELLCALRWLTLAAAGSDVAHGCEIPAPLATAMRLLGLLQYPEVPGDADVLRAYIAREAGHITDVLLLGAPSAVALSVAEQQGDSAFWTTLDHLADSGETPA